MELLYCICYYAVMGIAFFFAGRLISRKKFNYDAFPFKTAGFERGGLAYRKIGVHKWQNLLPDMSKVMTKLMPAKKLQGRPTREGLLTMINETCVAELVHVLLPLFGLAVLFIWPGAGGVTVWLIYFILGNLPYIIIQRYNRPRFIKLLNHCRE